MKQLFVPYNLAIKLKEKGFDERCFEWWYSPTQMSNDLIFRQYKSDPDFCEAPIYQQVVDWFREKHNIHICSEFHVNVFDHNITDYRYIVHYKSNDTWLTRQLIPSDINWAIEEALTLI